MTAVKFEFDTQFDGGVNKKEAERKALHLKELDATRAQAIDEGFEQGQQQALAGIEAQTNETVARIEASLGQFYQQFALIEQQLKQDCINLAYAIASRLVPTLLDKQPEQEILTLIHDCIETATDVHSIVILVHEEMLERIEPHMKRLSAQVGDAVEVKLKGDTTMALQDCIIEWPNGGASRDWTAINQSIEKTIEQWLNETTQS